MASFVFYLLVFKEENHPPPLKIDPRKKGMA
jgi:hypothetical protein